jgi:competence CoiA-like predicted nuclease
MMQQVWLKGKNSETGEEALVTDQFELLHSWHKAGVLVCPFCAESIATVHDYPRGEGWVRSYLRHKAECHTTLNYHPQSPEHFAAKEWIRSEVPIIHGYDCASADCEVRMPEINRIADVCFTLKNGDRIVHEAQLASIGVDELEERTNDYQSLGYGIVWHFGKRADTESNKLWALRRLGGCEILTFDERTVAF